MSKRIEWIDVCKGIAIILVVFGHTLTQNVRYDLNIASVLYWIIYFFHTRLFFMLSGYVFERGRKYNFTKFVIKKSKRLIIPYIIYAIVVFLMFLIINQFISLDFGYDLNVKNFLTGLLMGENELSIHLWFLYALFLIALLIYGISRYLTYRFQFVISVTLYLICFSFDFEMPYIVNRVIDFMPFYVLGAWSASNSNLSELLKSKKFKLYSTSSWLFMIFNALLRTYDNHNYWLSKTLFFNGFTTLFFSIGVVMSFIVISYSIKGKIKKILINLGDNSMIIYLLHQPFLVSGGITVLYKLFPQYIVVWCVAICLLGIIIPLILLNIYKSIRGY